MVLDSGNNVGSLVEPLQAGPVPQGMKSSYAMNKTSIASQLVLWLTGVGSAQTCDKTEPRLGERIPRTVGVELWLARSWLVRAVSGDK